MGAVYQPAAVLYLPKISTSTSKCNSNCNEIPSSPPILESVPRCIDSSNKIYKWLHLIETYKKLVEYGRKIHSFSKKNSCCQALVRSLAPSTIWRGDCSLAFWEWKLHVKSGQLTQTQRQPTMIGKKHVIVFCRAKSLNEFNITINLLNTQNKKKSQWVNVNQRADSERVYDTQLRLHESGKGCVCCDSSAYGLESKSPAEDKTRIVFQSRCQIPNLLTNPALMKQPHQTPLLESLSKAFQPFTRTSNTRPKCPLSPSSSSSNLLK